MVEEDPGCPRPVLGRQVLGEVVVEMDVLEPLDPFLLLLFISHQSGLDGDHSVAPGTAEGEEPRPGRARGRRASRGSRHFRRRGDAGQRNNVSV